jgi:restriction system protein
MANKKQSEFLRWMPEVLNALRALDGSGKPKEVSQWIAEELGLSDQFLESTTKSGIPRFHNQVQWARQYLVWEGLIDSSTRGTWSLTKAGAETYLDEKKSQQIYLNQVKSNSFGKEKSPPNDEPKEVLAVEETPSVVDSARAALLGRLKTVSPEGFERLMKYVVREMGFESVENTRFVKDQGIDGFGTLRVNEFITFRVIFQCKRYSKTPVSRSEVGDFRSAMIGRADKGIIFTTGRFSEDAKREANREGAPPIELCDGEKLVDLMERYQIGIIPVSTFEINEEFFSKFSHIAPIIDN